MRSGAAAVGASAAALLFACLFFGGAGEDERTFWIGSAAVVVGATLAGATLAGALPRAAPTRAGFAFLVLLAGLVAWTGASMAWSIVPDRSWSSFNRGLAYLGFAVVGVFVGAIVPRAPRVLAAVLAAVLGAALGWALLGKIFPTLFPDAVRIERLRNPVGYWNALALVADFALVLGLWLATARRHAHGIRAAGSALAYTAVVAVILTYSRAGVAVAAVVGAAWLALSRERLEAIVAAAIAVPPALAVAVLAVSLDGLGAGQPHSVRARDGAIFGIALLAGGCVVYLAAVAASRAQASRTPEGRRRRALERGATTTLAAGVAAGVVALSVAAGGPTGWWREFTSPVQVSQQSQRLTSASSNNRWRWWREAWQVFAEHPVAGAGAESYAVARLHVRRNETIVNEPHNTVLQFLSELGVVGLLLGAGATIATGAATLRAARRRETPDGAAALALGLGLGAYLLHALVDYDWNVLAVTGPTLLVAGALSAAGAGAQPARRRPLAIGGTAVLALAALYSLAAPWLAAKRVDDAYAALEARPARAVAHARAAHDLNPLAVDPLWAWALAEDARGDEPAAVLQYERAALLQPENPQTWWYLGRYRFLIGRHADACYALDLAYRLDPRGPAGRPGSELDRVKERLPGCPETTKSG